MSDDIRAHLEATGDDTRELLESLRRHLEDYAHRGDACEVCREYPEATPADAAATYLAEWPLEVVRRVGTPLAVVLGTGGPHCEIVRDVRPRAGLLGRLVGRRDGHESRGRVRVGAGLLARWR